ncbi:unnamed protein product [Pieris brassicae]|uniref:Uncharacterized protein n=1 Tax=Pieris brassicae TaxID=7116 RepID=A0A9P0TFX4_PIEBR|nr:unnamed protein product [Pieris brassicae]
MFNYSMGVSHQSPEREHNLLDTCYVRPVEHPRCRNGSYPFGELWQLPLEHEWMCGECGSILYDIDYDRHHTRL